MRCRVIDLGRISFLHAYQLQQQFIKEIYGQDQGALLLCEHDPVFTLGRVAREDFLLAGVDEIRQKGIEVVRTDRGGEVTFHGPGQLIAYPIFPLQGPSRDLKQFLHKLEEVIIDLLKYFGIVANRLEGYTGAWTGERKIASIGIGVRKWVTYHGIGLNVKTDLNLFSLIKPCGLDVTMTSMEHELGRDVLMADVKQRIADQFAQEFGLTLMDVPYGKRN